jgi:hypothetical protein
MNEASNIAQSAPRNNSRSSQGALIRTALMSAWIVFLVLRTGLKHGNHLSPIYLWLLVFPAASLFAILLSSKSVSRWTLGDVERIQIFSPAFEQKMRNRYATEISQLSSLGFDCAFFYGESFSIFRLALIFPAILTFSMWRKGVTMTLYQGTRLLNGNPVLVSRDKRAFAHTNGLGLTFHTAFRDGSVLASKDYGDGDSSNTFQVTIKRYKGASIGELCAQHQRSVSLLETDANPVDRQSTYDAYREIIRKEEARS